MRMARVEASDPDELEYTDISTDWHIPYVRSGQTLGLFDPQSDNNTF